MRLHRVNGTYEKRANKTEASWSCSSSASCCAAEPPSIGDRLLQHQPARPDRRCARRSGGCRRGVRRSRLAVARNRQGTGSFEGLFWQTSENVQGDERDHIDHQHDLWPGRSGSSTPLRTAGAAPAAAAPERAGDARPRTRCTWSHRSRRRSGACSPPPGRAPTAPHSSAICSTPEAEGVRGRDDRARSGARRGRSQR